MFQDPQTISIAGAARTMPRIDTGRPGKGRFQYQGSDGVTFWFETSQTTTKTRKRHEVRLTRDKIITDPLSGVAKNVTASAILTIDEPMYGFVDSELDGNGLTAYLLDYAYSNDVLAKMMNGES